MNNHNKLNKTLIIFILLSFLFLAGCNKNDSISSSLNVPKLPETEQPLEITVQDSVSVSDTEEESKTLEQLRIEIVEAKYITPLDPTVKVGQEVVFVNKHEDGKVDREFKIRGDRFADFESPILKPGESYTYVFSKPGDYQFKIMPGSAGRITVIAGNVVKWFSWVT